MQPVEYSLWNTSLHPDIVNILFENQCYIVKKFNDIMGFFELDHISISIITPTDQIIILSKTPSIEFNLVTQGLWQFDKTIASRDIMPEKLHTWQFNKDDANDMRIKHIKQSSHHFTHGFCITRALSDFFIIYNVATRETGEHLLAYYDENIHGLYDMGDYCYNAIHPIFTKYTGPTPPPKISEQAIQMARKVDKPTLRLVVNNPSLIRNIKC